MILLALLGTPLIGAAVLARLRAPAALTAHGACATATAVLAVLVSAQALLGGPLLAAGGLLRVDALSGWLTGLIGLVGGLAAVAAPARAAHAPRRFYPLLHLLVFALLLAVTTDDVGLMWVAIEGATVASVFLVGFDRTPAAVRAAYGSALIGSVGIALAFAGTVLMGVADVQQLGEVAHALRWTTLRDLAPALSAPAVGLAFALLLVGYGTTAGLAPMHAWLPHAHSEAPAPVAAMLSGALLSVGIYAVMRFKVLVDLAAGPAVARRLLLALALVSLGLAAARLWAPATCTRTLAYSSVQHAAIACLGLAVGGPWGTAGALLHIANHALVQSALCVLVGRVREAYGSAEIADVRGLLGTLPDVGRAFLAATLALVGLPPFGLFVSQLMIAGAGFQAGYPAVTLLALALIALAFGGVLRSANRMLYGEPAGFVRTERDPWPPAMPIAAALALLVLTGLAWPPGLARALERAAAVLGP